MGAERSLRVLHTQAEFELGEAANHRDFHAAELPGANGIANARSLARFYAGLIGAVDGGPSDAMLHTEQITRAFFGSG